MHVRRKKGETSASVVAEEKLTDIRIKKYRRAATLIEIYVSGSDDCVNRAPLFTVKAKKKVVKTFSNWIENFNFAPFFKPI